MTRNVRSLGAMFATVVGLLAPLAAGATTYLGFTVGVNSAPPPPRVVFINQPQIVVVPGTTVYEVVNTDYDLFRYGSVFYVYNGGYWYRSRRSTGPFVVVDVRSVPEPILRVPPGHWKHPHGGPPGLMRGGPPGHARGDRGRGRGHGH